LIWPIGPSRSTGSFAILCWFPVKTGTVKTGTVKTGTVKTGTVKTGTVKTGTDRTGTVKTGTVRSGSYIEVNGSLKVDEWMGHGSLIVDT
jgi:hypothetical protein